MKKYIQFKSYNMRYFKFSYQNTLCWQGLTPCVVEFWKATRFDTADTRGYGSSSFRRLERNFQSPVQSKDVLLFRNAFAKSVRRQIETRSLLGWESVIMEKGTMRNNLRSGWSADGVLLFVSSTACHCRPHGLQVVRLVRNRHIFLCLMLK